MPGLMQPDLAVLHDLWLGMTGAGHDLTSLVHLVITHINLPGRGYQAQKMAADDVLSLIIAGEQVSRLLVMKGHFPGYFPVLRIADRSELPVVVIDAHVRCLPIQ